MNIVQPHDTRYFFVKALHTMPKVASTLDTIININNDNLQGPEEKHTLSGQNPSCLQLLDLDVLRQHCDKVERLFLSERRLYKRLSQTNKENQQRQSHHMSSNSSSNIDDNNSANSFQLYFQEYRHLLLQLDAIAEHILLPKSGPDPHLPLPSFCVEDSTLESRLQEANNNKQDNRGLFHNLENPYACPGWAPALINNIYEPYLDLTHERQTFNETEDQEDYSPTMCLISSMSDVAINHKLEMSDWECDWVLVILEGASLDYSKVDVSLLDQVMPYPKTGSKTVYFNPVIQHLPYIAAERMTLPTSIFFSSRKICAVAAPPDKCTTRTILKPISAPHITDCTNTTYEPIIIARSKFNMRYSKNIPRLVEFAHAAETKLGLRIKQPTGY